MLLIKKKLCDLVKIWMYWNPFTAMMQSSQAYIGLCVASMTMLGHQSVFQGIILALDDLAPQTSDLASDVAFCPKHTQMHSHAGKTWLFLS